TSTRRCLVPGASCDRIFAISVSTASSEPSPSTSISSPRAASCWRRGWRCQSTAPTRLPSSRGNRSAAQQQCEPGCRGGLRGQGGARLGLFLVLAPGFDREALVELRGDEGRLGIETAFEQGERDDQRAAGGGRSMECRQREIVMRGDRRGKGREAGGRLR